MAGPRSSIISAPTFSYTTPISSNSKTTRNTISCSTPCNLATAQWY